MILKAAAGTDSGSRPSLVVLPVRVQSYCLRVLLMSRLQEVFNSPYSVTSFPNYAEVIGYTPGKPFKAEESASESVKMLSATAKEAGVWLLGGIFVSMSAEA